LRDKYINILTDRFSKLYDYYDNYYDDGLYRFQKGINFWADGICLPWNMQNAFALAMLEVYSATKEERYKNRLFEMADRFKKEFVYDGDRVMWHYWASGYYEGWTKEDNISINTPDRAKSEDKLYEDLSHAGINVKFILEFNKAFPEKVFTISDVNKLHKTIDSFIYDNTFSRFISGDTEYQKSEYRFLPSYGWSELNNSKLKRFYYPLNPLFYPDFDSQGNWIKYVNSINSINSINENLLMIRRVKYDKDIKIITDELLKCDFNCIVSKL